MTLNIRHRHVELTEAITVYVQDKMDGLTRYADMVRHIDVEVGKTTTHHKHGQVFLCRAIIELYDGRVLRIDRETTNLYKAIDKVRDHAKQELGEMHRLSVQHVGATA